MHNGVLNPENCCAHLDVVSIAVDNPYIQMFTKQLELQERLGRVPNKHAVMSERVKDIIYWGHCANDEFIELINWFPAKTESSLKELRMEYIDMLHFSFNIGIALSMTPETLAQGLKTANWYTQDVSQGLDILDILKTELYIRKNFCNLVALMPWKTWKTYTKIDPIDIHMPKLENAYFNYMKVVFSLAGAIGMDIQMVVNMYFAKNKENHRRQDNGY